MYKKVLVPLDGSQLAECSLYHINRMAKDRAIGEVVLLNVVAIEIPLHNMPLDERTTVAGFDIVAFRKERMDKSRAYLSGVESRLRAEGIKVSTESIEGSKPGRLIADYARQNGVDLIAISTHGYTGFKRMLMGSVAHQVLNESAIPVLVVRPDSCQV